MRKFHATITAILAAVVLFQGSMISELQMDMAKVYSEMETVQQQASIRLSAPATTAAPTATQKPTPTPTRKTSAKPTVKPTTKPTAKPTVKSSGYKYVGNKNTKVLHKINCSYVKKMNETNKRYYSTLS